MNRLYFGDNLDILRRHLPEESVDLVYLDPPFNSARDYNVLFREHGGAPSEAQILAFEDTWEWGPASESAYQDFLLEGPTETRRALEAFRMILGESDMMAYLAMMTPRLVELHRVLKPTGSLYLHCDPVASHYLKVILDTVFAAHRFKSEVVWKRTHAHGSAKRYGPVHDIILFYTKGDIFTWTNPKVRHDPEYLNSSFTSVDADGRRFQPITLTGAGTRNGDSGQPWRGTNPTSVGRHWALPRAVVERLGLESGTTQQRLDALDEAGLIYWPGKEGGAPRLKQYADELQGVAIPDVWTDIPPLSSNAKERLGYPTQKPEALLERIITASSNPGDLVLDPFCGCGTTVAVAQRLGRRWVGVDITALATSLIEWRLRTAYKLRAGKDYEVVGLPRTVSEARALASLESDRTRKQFEMWAVSLVNGRPTAGGKKGSDRGVDGVVTFLKSASSAGQIVVSVKSGKVGAAMVRDLRGVVEREKADGGLFVTLEPPTRDMLTEAAAAGVFPAQSGVGMKNYPKLQIATVEDLLEGRGPQLPLLANPYAQAVKGKSRLSEQDGLF